MYQYPDKNDGLTVDLITRTYDGVYWGESETALWDHVFPLLDAMAAPRRLLNLGCGMGRLLPVFLPHTDSILGLEPDSERCAAAQAQADHSRSLYGRMGGDEDHRHVPVVLSSLRLDNAWASGIMSASPPSGIICCWSI